MDALFRSGTELHYGDDSGSNRVDDGQIPDLHLIGHGHNVWIIGNRIYAFVCDDNGAGQEHVYMYYSDDAGVTWTTVTVDAVTSYSIQQVSSCVDTANNIHVVWLAQTVAGGNLRYVYYRKWTGAAFAAAAAAVTQFSNSASGEYVGIACNDSDELMMVRDHDYIALSVLDFGTQQTAHTNLHNYAPVGVEAIGEDFHLISLSNALIGGGYRIRHDMWDTSAAGPNKWSSIDADVIDGGTIDGEYFGTIVTNEKLQLAVYRYSGGTQGLYLFEYTPGGSWDAGTVISAGSGKTYVSIGWRSD